MNHIDPAIIGQLLVAVATLITAIAGYLTSRTNGKKVDHVIDRAPSKEVIEENTKVTKENTEVTQATQQIIQQQTGSFPTFVPNATVVIKPKE